MADDESKYFSLTEAERLHEVMDGVDAHVVAELVVIGVTGDDDRTPQVDVPTRTLNGIRAPAGGPGFCRLFGRTDEWNGDADPWDWTEDWIFQRPSTAETGRPGTITSQACPNCGASVNVDITSICQYCDAAVISGKFGWLLTRIDRV